MRKLILFCSVLALGTAKPNGYFHQEYSYKSSSSAYKNNELQHKKDDAAFYSKDGDLEGRLKPKVNSQSQHSEYTNPKLLTGSGGFSAGNSANYMAGSDRLFGGTNGQQSAAEGYASADRVLDLSNAYNARRYGQSYGSNQGYSTLNGGTSYGGASSNYGYTQHGSSQAASGSYATNANLNSLMQRLQEDMTRQMEQAIYKQYQTSGYSTSSTNNQMNADIRYLEEELKRNLTRQLQDSLRTSTIQTVPTYSNQELAALTRRLEDDLVNKLHQSVRTTYHRETSNGYDTYRTVSTTLRPYYDVITTPNDIRYPSRNVMAYPGSLVVETPIRYTPVPNPESLTQIASRTQADINSNLDIALRNLYATYLQTDRTSYYTISDFDNEVNRIKDDILRNLTYNLNDQIRRNYGQQVLKDNYYYTVSSNGAISTQSNYNAGDYDSLKKQVEENLLRKLNQQVNTYRDQYQRHQSQYRETYVTYRPVYYTSGNQLHDYSDLQRQLSQQLQNALNKHKYSQSSSYSSSTSHYPQTYQISLDELTRELQRNLTEQLGSFRASSGSSSSYGYSSGNPDFESMKNQLQNQLMQQLRQGLQNQYQYSASASYSASSSSNGMRQAYSYPSTCLNGCRRRRRDLHQYSYNSGGKRHGVKSVRRFSSESNDQSYQRYLHHPEDLSYPHTLSYNTHSTAQNSQRQEVEPDIVEDLESIIPSISSKGNEKQTDLLQVLEEIPNHPIRYAKQNVITQQLEEAQPLQNIHDKVGHQINQQLESGLSNIRQEHHTVTHSHKLSRFDSEHEGQLTLGQQTLGQQLQDQNLVIHSHSPRRQNQEIQNQIDLDQQTLEQHQKIQNQISLNQQTLGQQLEDQNVMGQLHDIPKIYDIRPRDHNSAGNLKHYQGVPDQLNLDQQTLGQQLEDQNLVGQLQMSHSNNQQTNLQVPKQNDQETLGQLYLEQQTSGQQLEDQNLIEHLRNPKHDQEIEGHLSFGQPQNPDQELVGQLTLGQETQQLENQYSSKHSLDFQKQEDLTQQLELEDINKPQGSERTNLDQQLQQISGDIQEQSPGQQLTDQTQSELIHPLYNEPKVIQLEPVQRKVEQDEDDNVQKLEVEENPVQKVDDELTQQLEIESSTNEKSILDQQQQNQEVLDQTLDFQESKPKPADDLNQQLEDLQGKNQKPESDFTQLVMQSTQDQQRIEDETTGLLLVHPKKNLELPQSYLDKHKIDQEPETTTTKFAREEQSVDQKLVTTNEKSEGLDQRLEEPEQRLEESVQKLEDLDQLEQKSLSPNNIGKQISEEDQNQILQPKKIESVEQGQQLENDFDALELIGAKKPILQNIPTLESTLSFSPDLKPGTNLVEQTRRVEVPEYHPFGQSERNFRYHSYGNNVDQNEYYPSGTYRGSYQRSFTNGHSGHFTADNIPSLESQTHINTYENALKQQDALMDLLEKKVQEIQTSNQNLFGGSTIKKTIRFDGETGRETSRIEPEVLGGASGTMNGQLDTYHPSFGHSQNWKTSNPTQWFTQQKGPERNNLAQFGTGGNGLEGFSGKATKKVVHYVNGKPVSASENVQIFKPNSEVIESTHNLPTDDINSLTNGISGSEFRQGVFEVPQHYFNNQNIGSKHIIQRTSHYVNGKLVDFSSSSKDISPDGKITKIEEIPRNEHFYSSRTKSPSYFSNIGY